MGIADLNAFNFELTSGEPLSVAFRLRGIPDFVAACHHVTMLPYKRNPDKNDPACVLKDGFGTCSTKHALLTRLAIENGVSGIALMLGMFKMQASNTPEVAQRLKDAGLDYIPEAHNYLRVGSEILDCTKDHFLDGSLQQDLMKEWEIGPDEITDAKVAIHKAFLNHWLAEQRVPDMTLEQLWAIREACIADLFTSC